MYKGSAGRDGRHDAPSENKAAGNRFHTDAQADKSGRKQADAGSAPDRQNRETAMFDQVQRKLALLCTAMAGAVLFLLLSVLFTRNIAIQRRGGEAAFQSLWMSISSQFRITPSINDSYLAQTEAAHHAIVYIEENGVPFFFPGAWQPESARESLIRLAMARAAKEGVFPQIPPVSSSENQTGEFQIRGSAGDAYYGRLLVLPSGKGAKSLLLLCHITPLAVLVRQQLPLYAFAAALGALCIWFVSRYITGRALRPAREAAVRQAEFIAAASHELRSPLAVIRSGCFTALQAASQAHKGNPDAAGESGLSLPRILSNMERECSRMARLVNDMLLLASADAGTWTLEPTELDADTLLMDTYETFLPLCRQKSISLSITLPREAGPRFYGDSQRIGQALAILLDNAVSYTPAGGTVHLSLSFCQDAPASLEFEVADSGPGIPDSLKTQIFDRFYRADSSRSAKKHFGLGLSIARELMRLHGGTIRVCDRPGGGSRFILRLPALRSDLPSRPFPEVQAAPKKRRRTGRCDRGV